MYKFKKPKCRILTAIVFSIFLLSVYFLVNNPVSAEAKKGKVAEVRMGKLERLSDQAWKEIKKDAEVSLGDRLRTDKMALAIVELPDIGRFVIGPDSEIELGKQEKDFNADLPRGAVWMKANLAKGAKASITSSLATAGIRGTKFSVFYGRGTLDVCVCTCIGDVTATLKDGKTVQVSKGTILAIKGDAPAPDKAESAMPILDKEGKGWDFCFNCHIEGG